MFHMMMSDDETGNLPEGEQRLAIRATLSGTRGSITVDHGRDLKITGWVGNLSTSGVYLDSSGELFSDGAQGLLQMFARVGQKVLRIQTDCTVVRNDGSGMGIQFDHPDAETVRMLELVVREHLPPAVGS
ncbi:MAG: PilZ domain-containing protein [Leptospirillia bacterium]